MNESNKNKSVIAKQITVMGINLIPSKAGI